VPLTALIAARRVRHLSVTTIVAPAATLLVLLAVSDAAAQLKCRAGKEKCVAQRISKTLLCHYKAQKKGTGISQRCLDHAVASFGAAPCKGCFELLEDMHPPPSLSPCLTFDDTHSRSIATRTFAACIATRLADPSSAPCVPTAPTVA